MKEMNSSCQKCKSPKIISNYDTVHNGSRRMYQCQECKCIFSETQGTPMAHVKTPLSKVASVFRVRSEGMGLRATFGIHNGY